MHGEKIVAVNVLQYLAGELRERAIAFEMASLRARIEANSQASRARKDAYDAASLALSGAADSLERAITEIQNGKYAQDAVEDFGPYRARED